MKGMLKEQEQDGADSSIRNEEGTANVQQADMINRMIYIYKPTIIASSTHPHPHPLNLNTQHLPPQPPPTPLLTHLST